MKKKTVITNVPAKFPFVSTVLYSFLLYYFKVDGLWWGIFITLYSIFWIIAIVAVFTQEKIDLDEDKPEKSSPAKSKFAARLEQLVRERNAK